MQLNNYLQATVDALPIGAAIFTGPEHTVSAVNPQMLAIWSKNVSVIGKPLLEAIPEIKDQGFAGLLTDIYITGEDYHNPDGKAELIHDGVVQSKFFDFSFKPLRDEAGVIYGIVNTAVDTSERVLYAGQLQQVNEELGALNEELRSTNEQLLNLQEERDKLYQEVAVREERLRFALNAAGICAWELDTVQQLIMWDDRCKELYGFADDDEIPYERVMGTIYPEDRHKVDEAVKDAQDPASGGVYDIQFRIIRSGTKQMRWLHSSGKVFFGDDERILRFSGITRDITSETEQVEALKAAHQQIIQKQEQLSSAKEAAQLGMFDWDLSNHTFNWDARFRQIYNLPAQEEFKDNKAVFDRIHPDDLEKVKSSVRRSQTFGVTNGRYDVQYRITATTDTPERWVRAIGSTLFDQVGTPLRFIGSVLDITEQKLEEQRKNDFIGIVSHELRSPLTSLNGYVQMLAMKAKKSNDDATGDITLKAKRQVDRMSGIISGFLDVARMGEGKISLSLKPFNMADMVKAAEEESLATVTSHQVIFHPVLFTPVKADQDKIEQVLVNLINNAVKYSPAGSNINVACITRDNRAHVSVTDEGMGIPAKALPHIFDRFYRVEGEHTKRTSGFGIGLYISKEIIESHGGQIGVESLEGKGSTFWFELPVVLSS